MVEDIIDKRLQKKGGAEYKVRWKSFGPDDDTWQPVSTLGNVLAKVGRFDKKWEAEQKRAEGVGGATRGRNGRRGGRAGRKGGTSAAKAAMEGSENEEGAPSASAAEILDGGSATSNGTGAADASASTTNAGDEAISKSKGKGKGATQKRGAAKGKQNQSEDEQEDEDDGDDADNEYDVDAVLGMRFTKSGMREFKIRWGAPYTEADDSWEPEANVSTSARTK